MVINKIVKENEIVSIFSYKWTCFNEWILTEVKFSKMYFFNVYCNFASE